LSEVQSILLSNAKFLGKDFLGTQRLHHLSEEEHADALHLQLAALEADEPPPARSPLHAPARSREAFKLSRSPRWRVMLAPAPQDLKRRVEEWKRKVLEIADRLEPSPEGFEEGWDYYDKEYARRKLGL